MIGMVNVKRIDTNNKELLGEPMLLTIQGRKPVRAQYRRSFAEYASDYYATGKEGHRVDSGQLVFEMATRSDMRIWIASDFKTIWED